MSAPDSEAGNGLKVLEAGADAAGQRLDQWLATALGADFSRNRVQALIRQGAVQVGGNVVTEAQAQDGRRRTRVGGRCRNRSPPSRRARTIPLDILYEDAELIVINKPPGLVVHPGAGNWTGTLVNALIHHCGDSLSGIGGVKRPGIVHRLDKETSGVMVVAKTDLRASRAVGGLCRPWPPAATSSAPTRRWSGASRRA